MTKETKMEMSRTVGLEKVTQSGVVEKTFSATADECVALAQRFGILSVGEFSGKVQISYIRSDKAFSVSGTLTATVTQECRTTFQPVEQKVSDIFDELLVTSIADAKALEAGMDDEQVVEVLEADVIDYGEIATQWLSLALDPFPRAEGQYFEHIEEKQEEASPFAALKAINLQNNSKK